MYTIGTTTVYDRNIEYIPTPTRIHERREYSYIDTYGESLLIWIIRDGATLPPRLENHTGLTVGRNRSELKVPAQGVPRRS